MTTILAIAGWVLVSTVCTPLIGQFLHKTGAERVQTNPHAKPRSTFGLARRDAPRRRPAAAPSRKAVNQPWAG